MTSSRDASPAASPSTPRQRSGFARVGLLVTVVAIVLVAWGLLSRQRASAELLRSTQAQQAMPVQVIRPQPADADIDLVLPGNVRANNEAPIYARTSGYLKRWHVDIGTPVKAGQVLADIEAPELDQQLRAAQAQLANSEATLQIAQVTADRWRDLRNSDSVSQQAADEKIAAAAASAAAVNAARAQVQQLRELTGFKTIVAPFDGMITARNTDVGSLISSGTSAGGELFRIADMRSLRLYVRVPQIYAASLRPGLVAAVRFPDRPGQTYRATLDSTSGAIDRESRTLLVQLKVDNSRQELLPGAYAEVHFSLDTTPEATAAALRVPANALLFRGDGLRVATVADDKVVLKTVTIGRDFGTEVEIASGLSADDRVIVAPPDSITDALPVRITAADEATGSAGAATPDRKS